MLPLVQHSVVAVKCTEKNRVVA